MSRVKDVRAVLSGEDRSLRSQALRGACAHHRAVLCNDDASTKLSVSIRCVPAPHRLPHPTISVGNITTGGTGKTPVVRWLAERLQEQGRRPAVLMRGYRSEGGISDEQSLLQQQLPEIPVIANPDRVRGAADATQKQNDIDTFILDDGFQHRRVHRDFDLVLIDATAPFGFGHILPRGSLREPLSGLRRANALLITRSSQVDVNRLKEIEVELARHSSCADLSRRSRTNRNHYPRPF